MRRILRLGWVLAANGFVALLTLTRLSAALSSRDSLDFEVWFEIICEALLPVAGIILEALHRKSAKWVNVGYLILAACFWLVEAVWWRLDSFFGVLLIMSVGLFLLSGLTEIIYRLTKEHEPQPSET